jgi:heat shock protein HslJ
MPDDLEPEEPTTEETPGAEQPKGIMVSLAVILIAILILLIIFMNLSGPGTMAATTITENPWSLQSFTSQDGTTTPVLNGTVITANFRTDGQLTGSGGCNQYSGRYMIQETRIVVSRVTTTGMSCRDKNATLQEEQYYASLEDASELRVHDRVLTLYSTDGKPLLVYGPANSGG